MLYFFKPKIYSQSRGGSWQIILLVCVCVCGGGGGVALHTLEHLTPFVFADAYHFCSVSTVTILFYYYKNGMGTKYLSPNCICVLF